MKHLDIVDQIQIAKPCPASWDDMSGDDRVRHCSLCQRNVYNLSAMSQEEAGKLVANIEGRMCVRFYRREDGKMMTADCPRGLAKARRRLATMTLAVCACLFSTAFAVARATTHRNAGRTFDYTQVQPFKLINEWANPAPAKASPPTSYVMGDIATTMPPSPSGAPGWSLKKGP